MPWTWAWPKIPGAPTLVWGPLPEHWAGRGSRSPRMTTVANPLGSGPRSRSTSPDRRVALGPDHDAGGVMPARMQTTPGEADARGERCNPRRVACSNGVLVQLHDPRQTGLEAVPIPDHRDPGSPEVVVIPR